MIYRFALVVAVMAVQFFIFSTSAFGKASVAKVDPCVEDARKYCAGVSVGTPPYYQCLTKNGAKLSAGCKDQASKAIATAQAQKGPLSEIGGPCAGDLMKFCPGMAEEEAVICLAKSVGKPGFNPGCKIALEHSAN